MSKLTESFRTVRVFNSYDFYGGTNQPYIYLRANSGSRDIVPSGWYVTKRGVKLSDAWYDYGCKTFSYVGVAGRKKALLDAQAWASEKFGVAEWTRDPFGSLRPYGVCQKSAQESGQAVTFSDLSSRFVSTILVLKQPASQATIGQHLRALNVEFGGKELAELDYVSLQKFFSEFSQSHSPKTVHNLWSSLRLVLNQAKREGLIQAVPEVQLPKCRRQPQPWFTEQQMRKIVNSGGPDQPLYGLLAETGLRIGEALAVRFPDIDFKAKTITVNSSVFRGTEQEPKTDAAFRTICISSRLRTLLASPGNGMLFPVSVSWALERFHRVLKDLRIQPCGFHAFRRGNSSLLQNKLYMPEPIIARRLGHTLKSMTSGTYNYGLPFEDRKWAEKIGRLLLP